MGNVEYIFEHQKISKAIAQMGLSPWKAAKICGIKPSGFYSYLKGTVKPGTEAFEKICNGLQIEPNYFFVKKIACELTKEVKA